MSGYDQLERQLLASIGGPRRSARRTRWLLPALSSAVVLAVAVFAVLSLGRHAPAARTGGAPPPTPTAHQIALLNRAQDATARTDPACRSLSPQVQGRAIISQAIPSAAMRSVLGVLRRPAPPAVSLPPSLYPSGNVASGIYVRYARLVRVVGGVRYYLIPAAQVGVPPLSSAVAGRCGREERAALVNELRAASASARTSTLAADGPLIAQILQAREHSQTHEGVFEFGVRSGGSAAGGGGISPQEIASRGMLGFDGSRFVGVVPSGVVTAILEWASRGHRSPLAARADVIGNLFVVRAPRAEGGSFPKWMVWVNAHGHVIRTVTNP